MSDDSQTIVLEALLDPTPIEHLDLANEVLTRSIELTQMLLERHSPETVSAMLLGVFERDSLKGRAESLLAIALIRLATITPQEQANAHN